MTRQLGCRLGVLSLWLCIAAAANAQSNSQENSDYRSAVRDALAEFDLGNWEEAQALFERAHAISPSARTLRGIGFCLFERRHYVDAVDHLQRALDAAEPALTGATRESAQGLLERALTFVAHLPLSIAPRDVALTVDGRVAQIQDGQLRLDPGEHEIMMRAVGRETRTLRVEVGSGANKAIEVELQVPPIATGVSPAASTSDGAQGSEAPERHGVQRTRLKRRLTIAGAVVLGVGAVSAAVTGGLALKQGRALRDVCPRDQCPSDKRDDLDAARTLALVSNISIGLVALGAGLCLAGILLPRSDDSRVQTGFRIGPANIEVHGRF